MTKLSYPKTILEFQKQFPDEMACIRYLYQSRWPDGFVCPKCGDKKAYYISTRRLFKCKTNGHHTYLTAGTIMHGSRQPLLYWFWAAFLMTTGTPGISALELQKKLGIKRYEVAYQLLQKLRASMVNPFRDKIGSLVEVDETYIGGPTTGGKRGRGTQKALVVIAVENRNGKAGRIRLRHIRNASEESLIPFITDNVNQGSMVLTDDFMSYRNLKRYGYKHKVVHTNNLPVAHIAISNLKTWLRGTHHGVSKKHLQAYLNEYVFRFNRRFYPMASFRTILGLSSQVDFPTYKGLYEGTWVHPNSKREQVR